MNVKHVQAEIKILPKFALGHGLFGVFVGGREHAHVHRRFHFAAQAPHFVVLEHAQQLRLRRRGHLADFVEQQRAAIGQLEAADAPLGRAGEGAALVAENFALHQRFGDRRTIDGDEGPVGARRKPVNRARQNFLARAGFAGDQHGGRRRRDLLDQAHDVLHRLWTAPTSSPSSRLRAVAASARPPAADRGRARAPGRAATRRTAPLSGFSMYQKAPASMAATTRSSLPLPVMMMAGTCLQLIAKAREEIQAVHSGQLDVGNQNGGRKFGKTSQGVFRAANAQDFKAPSAQQGFVAEARVFFVLDDQDAVRSRFRRFKSSCFSHSVCEQSLGRRGGASPRIYQ